VRGRKIALGGLNYPAMWTEIIIYAYPKRSHHALCVVLHQYAKSEKYHGPKLTLAELQIEMLTTYSVEIPLPLYYMLTANRQSNL